MHSADMGTVARPSGNFVRLSHLRRLRGRQQVAAVCYRMRGGKVEFLLVRTRGSGRWTFPKGSAEPGLTHAQAAALEAFEEAGVHGRMEEASFTSYSRKPAAAGKSSAGKDTVLAHLCEVTRLEAPQEYDRAPTWFSPELTKRSLREERHPGYAASMSRVVDRAVARISRMHVQEISVVTVEKREAFQKVQFIDCAWQAVTTRQLPSSEKKVRRPFVI